MTPLSVVISDGVSTRTGSSILTGGLESVAGSLSASAVASSEGFLSSSDASDSFLGTTYGM